MRASPQQLAAFTEVYRERSVTRAATALGVTQSAVTQHLARLEQIVGARLFVRHRSGLEPTRQAEELFALTDRLRVLEQLVAERIDAYANLREGRLTIIANAPRPAMPLIAAFAARHPGVRIAFSLVSWSLAMKSIEARETDVAIVTEPGPTPGHERQPLSRGRFVAIMRRDHPLARRRSLSLSDLAAEVLILPEEGSLTRRRVEEAAAAAGIVLPRIVEMTSFPLVREAAMHGLGLGVILEDSVFPGPEMAARRIRELPGALTTYLVIPADKRELRFVRAFRDCV